MEKFDRAVVKVVRWGTALGAVFLTGMMVLIVANVITRLTGSIITGSYEISKLLIVVTASFAMGYAALHGSHVSVDALIVKFPRQLRLGIEALMSLISLGTWAIVAWTSYTIISERALSETTELLLVPFLPFRVIWLIGLIIFSLVYLVQLLKSTSLAVKK